MSLPVEYFGSLLSPVVNWVCTHGSWQGWRERQSPHNLHFSSFVQEMAPFIWINAPCRLIILSTSVDSGIWLPGEKSDAFLIALEVQMKYRAYVAWLDLILYFFLRMRISTASADGWLRLRPATTAPCEHQLQSITTLQIAANSPCIPCSWAWDSRLLHLFTAWRCYWVRSGGS